MRVNYFLRLQLSLISFFANQLLAAVKSEQQCRESLEAIITVLKKNKKDRRAIVDEEERCRRILDKFEGAGGSSERLCVHLNESNLSFCILYHT
jgi:hypothetical protein